MHRVLYEKLVINVGGGIGSVGYGDNGCVAWLCVSAEESECGEASGGSFDSGGPSCAPRETSSDRG